MTTVVVIAKEPVAGRVKTRLCPPCTSREAADLAAAALADTLTAVNASACRARVLAFDGDAGPWLLDGWQAVSQIHGDLGRRLDAAVGAVAGPVLVVGMDTPQLTPPIVDNACEQLLRPDTDVVLGPAHDGGYWAIGFHDRRAGAFDRVAMSRPDTAHHQRARLDELGLRVTELEELRDVDTFDDARAVARLVPGSAFAQAFHRTQSTR